MTLRYKRIYIYLKLYSSGLDLWNLRQSIETIVNSFRVTFSQASQITFEMKPIIWTVFVPLVLGGCPSYQAPEDCEAPNLLCGGEPDENGCPTPQNCKFVEPYARCSAREFCPITCPPDTMKCSGGVDLDGCSLQEQCISINLDCPTYCPARCGEHEIECPGRHANGCQEPATCLQDDPNDSISVHCPVYCNDDQLLCRGGEDWNGNPEPDQCIPIVSDCPANCPANCGQHEIECPGRLIGNGCQEPNFCM